MEQTKYCHHNRVSEYNQPWTMLMSRFLQLCLTAPGLRPLVLLVRVVWRRRWVRRIGGMVLTGENECSVCLMVNLPVVHRITIGLWRMMRITCQNHTITFVIYFHFVTNFVRSHVSEQRTLQVFLQQASSELKTLLLWPPNYIHKLCVTPIRSG